MSGRLTSGGAIGGGVGVGGGSSTGRAIFAVCGGLAGAYYGFYLQSKYMEERRVRQRQYALQRLPLSQLENGQTDAVVRTH